MAYPNGIAAAGATNADNALLFTSEEVSECNEHVIRCTAGVVDVEITINAANAVPDWTDSATFPIAVMLLNATSPGTWVQEIQAGQAAVLTGRYDYVRVRQKGAGVTAAHMSSYVNFR